MNKAFFLDRDGTVNVDYNFVHTPEEWTWCGGAIDAIRWMNENDFKVIVVTNQSGITRGKYTEEQVHHLHEWVAGCLQQRGAWVDDWYIAPHHPEFDPEPCRYPKEDRKPGAGMFLKAAEKHQIDFAKSYMAGDKVSDLKPAVELGIKPLFIRSRHEPNQDKQWLQQYKVPVFDTLRESLRTIQTHCL